MAHQATRLDCRLCEVEARGKEVRVRAVDYPIEGLLSKMGEAVDEDIEIPSNVSGLVDLVDPEWRRIDHALDLFLRARGFIVRGKIGEGFQVQIWDPLYMASIGEHAQEVAGDWNPRKITDGIRTGYIIIRGHYMEPPYAVQVRTTDELARVYVNGVQIPKTYRLKQPEASDPMLTPPPKGPLEKLGVLTGYVGQKFADIRETDGKEEARREISAFLQGHPFVRSFEFIDDDTTLKITFEDGRKRGIPLYAFKPSWERQPASNEEASRRAAEYRERAIEKAAGLKKRIEDTLRANGLVLIPSKLGLMPMYRGKEAQERLLAICTALQEAVRYKDQLTAALLDLQTPQRSASGWEIFLNLRHRELWQRVRQETAH